MKFQRSVIRIFHHIFAAVHAKAALPQRAGRARRLPSSMCCESTPHLFAPAPVHHSYFGVCLAAKPDKIYGFTAIELIGVMALIFITASILIPVIYRSREMGRSAACVSNLKQIIQAVRLYADEDPYGRFPGFSPTSNYKALMPLLLPYLGQTTAITRQEGELKLFRCASNFNTSNMSDRQDIYGNQIDYEYNSHVNNQIVQTKVGNPEWVSVIYDWPPTSGPIHRGGTNIGFYDGHVQWYSTSQMTQHHAPSSSLTNNYATWGQN